MSIGKSIKNAVFVLIIPFVCRFTQICRSLLDAGINAADFASFFLPRLALLVKDPVVNVRIAASRTMHTLCSISKPYQKDQVRNGASNLDIFSH